MKRSKDAANSRATGDQSPGDLQDQCLLSVRYVRAHPFGCPVLPLVKDTLAMSSAEPIAVGAALSPA
jgi:hypothetical protein